MKSILNFRHKIEKYGFKCLEFGNPHPCVDKVRSLSSVALIEDIINATIFPAQSDDVTQTVCFADGEASIPARLAWHAS
jgi:hypothetical protein